MEDIFEKKIKAFLPYIIIIGIVYLVSPTILVFTRDTLAYRTLVSLFYICLFPLTALLCNVFYAIKKNNDIVLAFVAPALYLPSMFIYGNFKESWLNCIIFLVSYFLCGYIGLTLGDMLKPKKGDSEEGPEPSFKRVPRRVPTKVQVAEEKTPAEVMIEEHDIEFPASFDEEVETADTFDVSDCVETAFDSTADDIDAILAELRERRED